jgi:hypothetical protein
MAETLGHMLLYDDLKGSEGRDRQGRNDNDVHHYFYNPTNFMNLVLVQNSQ